GARLTGLLDTLAGGAEGLALDASAGKRSGWFDLAGALAWLAARGHAVDLVRWEDAALTPAPEKKPALNVTLSRADSVKPRPPRPAPVRESSPPRSGGRVEDPRGAAGYPPPAANGTHQPTMNLPSPPTPANASALAQALQVTRDSLAALERLQEQTAQLHR